MLQVNLIFNLTNRRLTIVVEADKTYLILSLQRPLTVSVLQRSDRSERNITTGLFGLYLFSIFGQFCPTVCHLYE